MPRAVHTIARDAATRLGPDGSAALAARVRSLARRMRTQREFPTAADLAQRFDPGYVRTPAINLLNARLDACTRTHGGRLVISIPPQEGKTSILQWLVAHVLVRDPDHRIVFASYSAFLARRTGRIVRDIISTHGDTIGLTLDRAHRDASDWQIDGHAGGLFTVGVGGSLTGRPADGVIVDDPLKNQKDADSDAVRGNLHDWWAAVARTRLAPGAWVIAVQTRWHEDDLAGRFTAAGWPTVNIPALADGKTADALDRPVGQWLESTRGRTVAEWETIRSGNDTEDGVGERVFAALYQGRPAPLAGGVFKQDWLDRDRVAARPTGLLPAVVFIDPADNTGGGDEAGVLVAAADGAGHIYLGPDRSGPYTTAGWVRAALLAAVEYRAATVAYEKSLSGLRRSVRDGWADLRKHAIVLRRTAPPGEWPAAPDPSVVDAAVGELTHDTDPEDTITATRTQLTELWPLVPAVLAYPADGPRVRVIVPKGSKLHRAITAAPPFENRRVHLIGRMPQLEHELCVAGGTLVRTGIGDVPIETVRAGDAVWTRSGWRRVTWSGQTGTARCATIVTDSGATLRLTEDHPVWVDGAGWLSTKHLFPGHRMVACPAPGPVRSSCSTASPTASTRTATTRPDAPAGRSSSSSTATCGHTTTADPFPTGGTSTTSTTTAATTPPATCALCPPGTIAATTHPTAGSACGPASSGRRCSDGDGRRSNRPHAPATSADAPTSRPGSERSSAPTGAARTTTATGDAIRPGPGTAPPSDARSTTVLSVEPPSGPPEPVYNLTVAEHPEFFANGLLVHNCTWQEGQASPNRLDVAVHAVHDLTGAVGARLGRSTDSIPTRSTSAARAPAAASRLTRSTHR